MIRLFPLLLAASLPAQVPPAADRSERWNWYAQTTSIGDYHPEFHAPYSGPFSLQQYPERDVSLTTTFFLGLRIARNTQFYFNPELAGGRGFSGTNGVANFPNGEITRVASATPKPYLARAYLTQDFGFGDEQEKFSSEPNQLAGTRPMKRYSVTVGRFTVTDFFDNNRYSHDPRTQFMGWATMYNGAWDYPADTRGYTWGWVHEVHMNRWSVRYGSAAEPKVANGSKFDRRLFVDRGDMVEGELRYAPGGHAGAVRLLGFWLHTDSGSYAEAMRLAAQTNAAPDVTLVHRPGTLKYGGAINLEQEITPNVGIFARLGWNDGKTASFAFTAMDRLASGGVSVTGTRWKRPNDTAATALTVGGISGLHASYLAQGGKDFLIGDGRLTYAPEYAWETYYSARVLPGFFTSLDVQHIVNPAYNQDRGPVWVWSLRLHIEFGRDLFSSKGP
jgi:high affinity Mn2+ porin